jgi:hypothetical protein
LERATLNYTVDGWRNVTSVEMAIVDNKTCSGVIPRQAAGTVVGYRVEALDVLLNVLSVNGSYVVKNPSVLNVSVVAETVFFGGNITVRGYLSTEVVGVPIVVQFDSANETRQIMCSTLENGTFTVTFMPTTLGVWGVQARYDGDDYVYGSVSAQLMVRVEEAPLYVRYAVYYFGVVTAVVLVSIVVYLKKSKG